MLVYDLIVKLKLVIFLFKNIIFGSQKYGGLKLGKEGFKAFIIHGSNIVIYWILDSAKLQDKLINTSRNTIYLINLNDGKTQKFPIDQIQSMEGVASAKNSGIFLKDLLRDVYPVVY